MSTPTQSQLKVRHLSHGSWLVIEPVINRRLKEAKSFNLGKDYICAIRDIKKLIKNMLSINKETSNKRISRRQQAQDNYFSQETLGKVNLDDPLRILIKNGRRD